MDSLIPSAGSLDKPEAIADHYAWPEGNEPWVRMNFVTTVDGAAWGNNGLSDSITTAADREVFGVLRATSDAILVGSGTAVAEGYGPPAKSERHMALRSKLYESEPPLLAVVSGSGKVPADAPMFEDDENQPQVYSSETEAIEALKSDGVKRILCEGGPHMFTSLLQAGVVNDVCLTISPQLVGPVVNGEQVSRIVAGDTALAAPVDLELTRLAHAEDGTLLGIWQVQS